MSRAPKTRRAALLLEALLSLLIVSIFVGALSGLFSSSLSRIRQARLRTRAMLMAESKLAEIQVGLVDLTDTTSGDFDGRIPGMSWNVDIEPLEEDVLGMRDFVRLVFTVSYDDGSDDAFTFRLCRLFSPSLNFSYEKLKDIAADPAQQQAVESGSDFQALLVMLNELPGSERLLELLMAGGVTNVMTLLNKAGSGSISTEELLSQLGSGSAEGSADAGTLAAMIDTGDSRYRVPVWSNDDTAGTGEGLAAAQTRPAEGSETVSGQETSTATEASETTAEAPTTQRRESEPVSRREAMQHMMDILRRMAAQRR